MIKKYLFFVFLLLLLLINLFSPKKAIGATEFSVDSIVRYEFLDNGEADVVHEINLENNISTLYAKSYSVSFKNIKPENISVFDKDNNLYIFSKSENGDETTIKIDFPDNMVGKGVVRKFYIKYSSKAFSKKYGEIFEVNIPKLTDPDNYRNYEAEISIPKSYGKKSYISPNPTKETDKYSKSIYLFNKSLLSSSAIAAAFGDFQVFNFILNYHLENPLSKIGETEIVLPPDTSFQRIYYEDISPKPLELRVDEDGNWLAKYFLNPRQNIDIVAKGSVKIFSKGIKTDDFNSQYLYKNTLPTEYWQSDYPEIRTLANNLKTPKNIYNFVVNKLTYDYKKVNPDSERLGALKALEYPKNAICMEFSDLFIAISRAAGIPAREINGYAHADNPAIQPMSLVADVLHAWPEYWDEQKSMWVPVDPTWGNTTGGEDFFNKLDLRHFTFVIHGLDVNRPYPPGSYKLGENPEKDIFISFGKLPEDKPTVINFVNLSNKNIYFPGKKIKIKIENSNGYSIENENVLIYFDGKEKYNNIVPIILPFSSYTIEIDYPFSILGRHSPKEIKISFLENDYNILGIKNTSIIISLILIFLVLSMFIIIYIVFLKRNSIVNLLKIHFNKKSITMNI